MFSYFGSKSKLIKKYPAPKHNLIIEPFAGSARYALEYFDNDVIINDINPVVMAVWTYLLQASEQDILSLPILKPGEYLKDFNLTDAEKWLIGFELCRGKFTPRKTVSKFSDWPAARIRIANNLFKIKHWTLLSKSYNELSNTKATWFIDPPYTGVNPNHTYPYRDIDYTELAEYCKTREGQTIVCGGTYDTYLPFELLTPVVNGRNKQNLEKIFYKYEH